MRLVVSFVFMLTIMALNAQQIYISKEQRLSGKSPRFQIIGKNQQGILLRKYGKSEESIDLFSYDLSFLGNTSIKFEHEINQLQKIQLLKNGLRYVYTLREKDELKLYAQTFDIKLEPTGKAALINRIRFDERQSAMEHFKLLNSQDRKAFASVLFEFDNNSLLGIRVQWYDGDFNFIGKKNIKTVEPIEAKIFRAQLANNGLLHFILLEKEDRVEEQEEQLQIWSIGLDKPLNKRIVPVKEKLSGSILSSYDNQNNQLWLAGFYQEKVKFKEAGILGCFYLSLDSNLNLNNSLRYIPTSDSAFKKLTEQKNGKNTKLYDYRLEDLVLRKDGGLIMIAEFFNRETNSLRSGSSFGAGVPSYRTINAYNYGNIYIQSIGPDGKLDWFDVLPKNQRSEEDNGAFSSYCIATKNNAVHFFFNDEILSKGNLLSYKLTSNGLTDRKRLLNLYEHNLMLVPKMAKQLSLDEVIIPSYKRNNLKLIKVDYSQ